MQSNETRATRLRRLIYRAWHRGTKEADLLIGPFADARLDQLSDDELDIFEALLREPDPELVAWLTRQAEPPEAVRNTVLDAMIEFQEERSNHCR